MNKSLSAHIFSLILPFSAIILIPCLLLIFPRSHSLWGIHLIIPWLQSLLGGILFLLGLLLLIRTVTLFDRIGQGTLAPWNPTRKLVIAGPYRYTRNPMILGVLSMIGGETIFFGSLPLLLWFIFFWLGNHIYFIASEEPGLIMRLGEEYEQYRKTVPRWIPKLREKRNFHKEK